MQKLRTHTPPPQAPPTYLFLVGEYMATLETMIATKQGTPFMLEQMRDRLAYFQNLQVADIDPTRIVAELVTAKRVPSLLFSETPETVTQ